MAFRRYAYREPPIDGGYLRSREPLHQARKSVISLIGKYGETDVSLARTRSRYAGRLAYVAGGGFHNQAARFK